MTPSCLSSTHHGHIHTTFPPCRNWTTLPLRLLLPRHPYLPVLHLHLWRAPWNSTPSPDELFPIKRDTSRTQLRPHRYPCLSHIVKRGRTAPPPSEFFGPYHSRGHSATHHHHHHHHRHRHHGTSLKYLRLRSRGDASSFRHSRHSPLHKSTFRYLLYYSFFVISFSYHCSDILM
jgi:hypothetical protein